MNVHTTRNKLDIWNKGIENNINWNKNDIFNYEYWHISMLETTQNGIDPSPVQIKTSFLWGDVQRNNRWDGSPGSQARFPLPFSGNSLPWSWLWATTWISICKQKLVFQMSKISHRFFPLKIWMRFVFWVNFITTSLFSRALGMMVSRGDYPQPQVSG